MYTMVGTRSDLAFPVSMVSQFMLRAGACHWMDHAVLEGHFGLEIVPWEDVSLKGYCDADWGGDANERRSTTG
jgi:hypothetical protein